MTKILILGAGGQIARFAIDLFLALSDVELTLYLRDAHLLDRYANKGKVQIIQGDVLDAATLDAAMKGQDAVYANLSGRLEAQARTIVTAMHKAGVSRLVFVSSMGIYGEVPGESYGTILDPNRKSARISEGSDLDYTILRPAWLNNRDEITYATTQKGEPFASPAVYVSRKSVADLVERLATEPEFGHRESLGVHRVA